MLALCMTNRDTNNFQIRNWSMNANLNSGISTAHTITVVSSFLRQNRFRIKPESGPRHASDRVSNWTHSGLS